MHKIKQEDLKFFYCYDRNVVHELRKCGFKPITVGKHIKTEQVYSMYYRSEELDYTLGLILDNIKRTKQPQ